MLFVLKAAKLASYEATSFDFMQKMLQCKQKEISDGGFRIMLDRTDPSKYLKWNMERIEWINSV